MKKVRILCFCLFLCLTALLTAGCTPEWVAREQPAAFLGSIWESEDGKVRFENGLKKGLDGYWEGSIEKDGVQIEMLFQEHVNGLQGAALEDYVAAEPDERGDKFLNQQMAVSGIWELYHYIFDELHGQDNYFTVEVYESCIYEIGQHVTFYRVDDTKDIWVQSFSIGDYERQIEKYSSDRTLATSEDIKTAISQGTLALEKKYGSSSGKVEVYYNELHSCWMIKRKPSYKLFGSTAYIIFQTDGTVLAMWED